MTTVGLLKCNKLQITHQVTFDFLHFTGHWTPLRPLPQRSHRFSRERSAFQRKAPQYRHGRHQGTLRDVYYMYHYNPHVLKPTPSCVIQLGKLAKELDFVSHHVRTKLDELKRQEVNRLRTLIKAKQDLEGGNGMLCKWLFSF